MQWARVANAKSPKTLGPGGSGVLVVLLIVVAVLGWFLWLGWHEDSTVTTLPDGSVEVNEAYMPWQWAGCAATLSLAIVVSTWLGSAWLGVCTLVVTLVVVSVADWSTTEFRDAQAGLWPIAVMFLAVCAAIGLPVVAALTRACMEAVEKRSDPTS